MKPILFIGYQAFVLKDTAHLQTVLKALGDAQMVKHASDAEGNLVKLDGKYCYQVEADQREARVEMVADKRVFPVDWTPAIEPEVIEEPDEVEIDLTAGRARRRPKRKALPAPAPKVIDARAGFAGLRDAVEQPQLLLEGGVS